MNKKRLKAFMATFFFALWLLCPMSGWGDEVRIRLFESAGGVQSIQVEGRFQVQPSGPQMSRSGRFEVRKTPQGVGIYPVDSSQPLSVASRLRLVASTPQGLRVFHRGQVRRYDGTLEIEPDGPGGLRVINTVSALRYVESVVGSETPPGWPLEALKAQAVLTQTRLKTRSPGMPLGDSTQSEVYHGLDPVTPAVQEAVLAVWGKVLIYQGHPATVFYHSTCGGRTSPASLFRPQNPDFTEKPYLTTVRCTTCGASPFFTPTTHVIPAARFRQVFKSLHPKVIEEDGAGRPVAVRLKEGETVGGYEFWLRLGQVFGWDKAPGTQFSLKRLEGGDIEITSRGAGHGIGLCQWGAAGLARQGKSYSEILMHYFPGTKIPPPMGFQGDLSLWQGLGRSPNTDFSLKSPRRTPKQGPSPKSH